MDEAVPFGQSGTFHLDMKRPVVDTSYAVVFVIEGTFNCKLFNTTVC